VNLFFFIRKMFRINDIEFSTSSRISLDVFVLNFVTYFPSLQMLKQRHQLSYMHRFMRKLNEQHSMLCPVM